MIRVVLQNIYLPFFIACWKEHFYKYLFFNIYDSLHKRRINSKRLLIFVIYLLQRYNVIKMNSFFFSSYQLTVSMSSINNVNALVNSISEIVESILLLMFHIFCSVQCSAVSSCDIVFNFIFAIWMFQSFGMVWSNNHTTPRIYQQKNCWSKWKIIHLIVVALKRR